MPHENTPLRDLTYCAPKEWCDRVKMGRTTLHKLMIAGLIKSFKVGRRRYVDVQSGLDYIRSQAVETKTAA